MGARVAHVRFVLLFMLTAWMAAACSLVDEDLSDLEDPTLTLAMSVRKMEEGRPVTTKMSQTITQNNGYFRGIEQIHVIPFATTWSVTRPVESEALPVGKDSPYHGSRFVSLANPFINDLPANNNARLFEHASVPKGTNRVLIYGEAMESGTDEIKKSKHINGVLTAQGMDILETAGDIRFCLEPILIDNEEKNESSEIIKTADGILRKLNNLISLLQKSQNESLQGVFNQLKLASENQILACATIVFNYIRNDLAALLTLPRNSSNEEEFTAIIDAFQDFAGTLVDEFPSKYGIPDGAMGFWWNGKEFIRLINGVSIALVNPGNYSYPPSLWYYANSAIQTSDKDYARSWYISGNSWTAILDQYNNGEIVNYSTKSVAIDDPLQYGVGMLELSLQALNPAQDEELISQAGGCTLTGIIIGGQRDVGFDFQPLSSIPEAQTHYIYDNEVLTANKENLEIGADNGAIQTLVLQTKEESPVHFALEFKNTTGKAIRCQQGNILPNCKFYLAGELVPSDRIAGWSDDMKSVFKQDRKTTVSIKINSMKKAYNTVPDLRDPQLEIGISAEMKWTQVTPQGISMNL